LGMKCPRCKTENPQVARFCLRCSTRLVQVCAKCGTEPPPMEIMDGAFDVLIEPVVQYGGTLARLMGDAALAFFGAPIAREDDLEQACRAALEITAEARGYAEELERERGVRGFPRYGRFGAPGNAGAFARHRPALRSGAGPPASGRSGISR
jgi:hypothetical protein